MQVTNTATGFRRSTVTSGDGEFSFQDLPLGEYDITVTQPGFEKLTVEKFGVEVGKITSLRLSLVLAAQAQTIEVSSTVLALNTETGTLHEVMPNKAVQEVPLNGRDFTRQCGSRA